MSSLFKQVLNNGVSEDTDSVQKKILTQGSSINKDVLSSSSNKKVLESKSALKQAVYQPEPVIKCMLYMDKVFDSINLKNEKFINFLPEKLLIDEETSDQLKFIANNHTCIYQNYDRHEAPSVRYHGDYKEHILNILKEYEQIFGCDSNELEDALKEGRIRKSVVPNGISKGKIRVISLYEKNIEENQSYFHLLFIDFYHLFIPSGHAGLDAKTNSSRTYNSYSSNKTHLHEIFKKEKFIWHTTA